MIEVTIFDRRKTLLVQYIVSVEELYEGSEESKITLSNGLELEVNENYQHLKNLIRDAKK